ncbi:M48 family metalloprotease [Chloroflexota bacterium]
MNEVDTERLMARCEAGLLSDQHIASKRLVSLLDDVWRQLPELDRHVLRETIADVTDDPGRVADPARVLGTAGPAYMGEDLVDGLACTAPEDAQIVFNIDSLDRLSDEAASAVVAHELAHILLRHPCLTHALARKVELGFAEASEALDKAKALHEWEADLQVWIWGFTAELRCLWKELGDDLPPWYHQIELEEGPA